MPYHQGPYQNMSPSGFIGLVVCLVVVFSISTFFAPREFAFVVAGTGVCGAALAIFLHFRFLRQAREQDISLLLTREEMFQPPDRNLYSSHYEEIHGNSPAPTCPYCKNRFQFIERVMFCNKCHAMHHLDCWNANRGCGIFGCEGRRASLIRQKIQS